MAWLRIIGDKVGAYEQYFRHEAREGDARALPPKGKDKTPVYVEFNVVEGKDENTPNNLRLYCHRANESVVFLFNGDIKTAKTSQECKNVKPHFELPNKLSKVIDKAFINDEIRWVNNHTDIEIDDGFMLHLD